MSVQKIKKRNRIPRVLKAIAAEVEDRNNRTSVSNWRGDWKGDNYPRYYKHHSNRELDPTASF